MQTVIRNRQSGVLLRYVSAILPGLLLAVLTAGVPLSSHAAILTYDDPACNSFDVQNNGGGSFTLVCVKDGGSCSISANPSSMTSGGGSVTLTGTCSGATGSTTYTWTRNPAGSTPSATNTWVDNLPANTGTSPVSYAYTVEACNGGTDCVSGRTTLTVPAPTPVGAPSCPSPSVSPTSLTSGGGAVTLTKGTCTNTTGSTVYTWTRSSSISSFTTTLGNVTSDSLGSNSSTSAVTYTYSLSACNGTTCSASVTAGSVTVAGQSGGGQSFCAPGYNPPTLVMNGSTIVTDLGTTGVLAAKFTLPPGYTAADFTVVERASGRLERTYAISTIPCDFTSPAVLILDIDGSFARTVMPTVNKWKYPVVPPGTYYLNIKNMTALGFSSCQPGMPCTLNARLGGY